MPPSPSFASIRKCASFRPTRSPIRHGQSISGSGVGCPHLGVAQASRARERDAADSVLLLLALLLGRLLLLGPFPYAEAGSGGVDEDAERAHATGDLHVVDLHDRPQLARLRD